MSTLVLGVLWAAPEPLLIAAAADLAPAEQELTAALSRGAGAPVRFSLGSSGQLARQIRSGAPFDLYLSANESFVRELAAAGAVRKDTVTAYAVGRIGLWGKKGDMRTLNRLTQADVRHVALPNPDHAPYGVAAREALIAAGLWEAVKPKVVYAENARQALQFAETGNADAVITSWSLLMVKGAVLLPAAGHRPVVQAGAVVSGSKQAAAASAALRWLSGPEGRKLLARYGFEPPR